MLNSVRTIFFIVILVSLFSSCFLFSFCIPYILYNKVYPPSPVRLLSILHSFFFFFLNFLLCFFGGLRKCCTFALAKREQLLQTGGVGFLTRIKKEFFDRFS